MASVLQYIVLVLLLLVSGAAGAREPPRFEGRLAQFVYLMPPQPVQAVGFHDADWRVVNFGQFRGKIVLVNLWATWCAPCAAEMPTLDGLQARLGGDRFAVVAIALDTEGLPPVAAFFRRQKLIHLPIYLDPEHRMIRSDPGDKTDAPLPLYEMPMSYLLDQQGRAIGYLKGPAEWNAPQAIGFLEYFIAQTGSPSGR